MHRLKRLNEYEEPWKVVSRLGYQQEKEVSFIVSIHRYLVLSYAHKRRYTGAQYRRKTQRSPCVFDELELT